MRPIKFRFFRTKEKEMVYGFKGCSTTYVLNMWENEKHVSEPTQYTGLKDKNGTEIYEGDILVEVCNIGKVVYEDGKYAVEWDGNMSDDLVEWAEYSDIIGNIYDNPELLEGE